MPDNLSDETRYRELYTFYRERLALSHGYMTDSTMSREARDMATRDMVIECHNMLLALMDHHWVR